MSIRDIKQEASRIGAAVTALQQWRIKDEAAHGRKPDGYWHPSAISGCPTAAVFEALEFNRGPKHDARLLRIFDTGHALHAMLQDQFVKAGVVPMLEIEGTLRPAVEVPFTNEKIRLRGTMDLIFEVNGKRFVGELKTKNSHSFAKLVEPDEPHKVQVACYTSEALDRGWVSDPISRIIYFSKDDAHMAELKYEVTPANIKTVHDKIGVMNEMVDAWKSSAVFPSPYYKEPHKPPCRTCPWSTICHATFERERFIREATEKLHVQAPSSTPGQAPAPAVRRLIPPPRRVPRA